MRALLLLSTAMLLGCSALSRPVRAASLGAPTTVTQGERELLGGGGFMGPNQAIAGENSTRIGSMALLAGTWREGLSDRVSIDLGGEMILAQAWRPNAVAAIGGLRYTTDPRPRQARAVWADLEAGVGANLLIYDLDGFLPGVGAYAGAGVAARFGKVTTFARYRVQISEGRGQATADYHAAFIGVQGPLSPRVDLYAATGLATAGGRSDLDRSTYKVYGPYPLHIDLGVRVRLPDRGTSGGLPEKRTPRDLR